MSISGPRSFQIVLPLAVLLFSGKACVIQQSDKDTEKTYDNGPNSQESIDISGVWLCYYFDTRYEAENEQDENKNHLKRPGGY